MGAVSDGEVEAFLSLVRRARVEADMPIRIEEGLLDALWDICRQTDSIIGWRWVYIVLHKPAFTFEPLLPLL